MIYQVHKNHGRHIAYSEAEAKTNRENGWSDVAEVEFYPRKMAVIADDLGELTKAYKEKFGKNPHHKMKAETIKAALDGSTG